MFGIKRQFYAPVERRAGYAQVFQSGLDKVVYHFVHTGFWRNKIRIFLVELDQAVLVFGKAEKVTFFLFRLNFSTAIGTFSVHKLAFRPKTFAGRAIQAFVAGFVNISGSQQFFVYFLYGLFVIVVGGADKLVVGNIQHFPKFYDLLVKFVHKLLGGNTGFFGFLLHLLTVFVRTCKVKHVKSVHSFEARYRVATDGRVAVSDVEISAAVIDWGCDVVSFFVHFDLSVFRKRQMKPLRYLFRRQTSQSISKL